MVESSLASITDLINISRHGLQRQTADVQQIVDDLDELQRTLDLLLTNTTGQSPAQTRAGSD